MLELSPTQCPRKRLLYFNRIQVYRKSIWVSLNHFSISSVLIYLNYSTTISRLLIIVFWIHFLFLIENIFKFCNKISRFFTYHIEKFHLNSIYILKHLSTFLFRKVRHESRNKFKFSRLFILLVAVIAL